MLVSHKSNGICFSLEDCGMFGSGSCAVLGMQFAKNADKLFAFVDSMVFV